MDKFGSKRLRENFKPSTSNEILKKQKPNDPKLISFGSFYLVDDNTSSNNTLPAPYNISQKPHKVAPQSFSNTSKPSLITNFFHQNAPKPKAQPKLTELRDNPFDADLKIIEDNSKPPMPIRTKDECPIPSVTLPQNAPLSKTAILDSHYTVMKKGFLDHQFEKHRKWLTVEPKRKEYAEKKKPKKAKIVKNNRSKITDDGKSEVSFTAMKLFYETRDTFTVPRFYGIARWGMVPPSGLRTNMGKRINVKFVGTLTQNQEIEVDRMAKYLTSNESGRGGIFKCPCGFGKTISATAAIARIGRKCLFTIHKEKLMLNIKKELQKWLPDAKIGIIQGNLVEVEGYDICIAMIQSILSRDHSESIFKDFGLWIPDEAHHISAPSFSQIRNKIKVDKIMALTATPHKGQFPMEVLLWYLGPIVVNVKRTWELVYVIMVRYTEGDQKELLCKDGSLNNARMITRLAEMDYRRNYMICKDIAKEILNPDPLPRRRKCLGIGDRLKQLDIIRDRLIAYFTTFFSKKGTVSKDESISNKIRIICKHHDTNVEEEILSIGYMVGGLSEKETEAASTCDVILATYAEAEEGVNVPTIDTVFLLTPRSDVEQAVGRGLRNHPLKNIPRFYYYADDFSLFQKQGKKVERFFKEEDYRITWRLNDGVVKSAS